MDSPLKSIIILLLAPTIALAQTSTYYGNNIVPSGATWDFASGSSVDFTGATVTGLSFPGGVVSITLNTPAILYSNPVNFANASGAWSGTLALLPQIARSVFSNNTGASGVPAFTSAPQFLKIGNLTSNGFVKTVSGDGTLSVDTATYITGNQTITASGDATGSGTTSLPLTITGVQGKPITLATGYLKYNGTAWVFDNSTFLTGNQSITLSGDVTGSGATAITATIPASTVTYAKMQNVSANSVLLGSSATGSGAPPSEITLGTNLSMSGSTLNASGGGGTPGGSNTQMQYNNSSAFGGTSGETATATQVTLTSPRIVTNVQDTNGNVLLGITATGSAVNNLTLANSATGTLGGTIGAAGTGTNLDINITPKGTGQTALTAGNLSLASTSIAKWSTDTGLTRNAAGVVEVNSTTTGQYRDLKLRKVFMLNSGFTITNDLFSQGADVSIQTESANSATGFFIIPKGTATNNPSYFQMFGTDLIADGTNYERLLIKAKGSGDTYYTIQTTASGTGSLRPISIDADNTTTQFVLSTDGGVSIGTGTSPGAAGILNVNTGFRVANAAASGNVLRGNGTNFVSAALQAGDISPVPGYCGYKLSAVNFNSANTDNAITLTLPTGYTRWRIISLIVSHPSTTFSTATFNLYTAASAGGTALLSATTTAAFSSAAEGTNGNMMSPALFTNANTQSFNVATIYFRTITAQGSAATADVDVTINALP